MSRWSISLRGEALKHFTYLSDRTDYAAIKSKMRELFQVEITAAIAHMNGYSLRQKESESEEAFAKRILDIEHIGYYPEDRNQSQMAADFFVRGCRDAEAKRGSECRAQDPPGGNSANETSHCCRFHCLQEASPRSEASQTGVFC